MILSRFRLWLKQQLVGGFSLVELMVTITLMAIVGRRCCLCDGLCAKHTGARSNNG